MHINEIGYEHIERLRDFQLVRLLHLLLNIEIETNSIQTAILVPFNINTGDGGDDGRVKWDNGQERTKRFTSRFNIFQSKATNIAETECYEEILLPFKEGLPRELKPRIKELIEANGTYYLFTNAALTSELIARRIRGFKKAIKEAGYNQNYERIEIYDANKIKDWVNQHISAITLVQGFNDITRLIDIKTWEEWKNDLIGVEVPYQINDIITSYFRHIHSLLNSKKPTRIIGQSGLGKTRMVFEFFRNELLEGGTKGLQQQVVYIKIRNDEQFNSMITYINSHKLQEGIIVIDDCDEIKHKIIIEMARSSKFRIITIDISTKSTEENVIRFDKTMQMDIVKKIIEEQIGGFQTPTNIEYIINLSDGYPWLAVNFCKAIKANGLDDFRTELDDEVLKKLLFGTSAENELEYRVIRSCSVFASFGFIDKDLTGILNEYIESSLGKEVEYIRKEILEEEITENLMYEIIQEYKRKDIIERRGTKLLVRPAVLAINLATDWIKNTPPKKILKITKDLLNEEMSERFAERLGDLDQSEDAVKIINFLWGPESPFGKAEVLNTEKGSLFFRYIVDVNPIATVKTLEKVFLNLTKEELLNFKVGRRNLVWALEKLCFREETFSKASKVLLAFAASENENWANNATGQFVQLFQVLLSGTEANLDERFSILEYGLSKGDPNYDKVVIKAMDNALRYGHFSRSGIANRQGSSVPLKDYQPKTYGEIFQYWEKICIILTKLACSEHIHSEIAKETLAKSFRTLISMGKYELVEHTIRSVIEFDKKIWLEGIKSLKNTILYENRLNAEVKAKITTLINEFEPKNIEEKILMIVSKPDWDSREKDDSGNYTNTPGHKAKKFAEEILNNNIDISEHYHNLLKGEQRQGVAFGYYLGEGFRDKEGTISSLIDCMKEIDDNELNIDFFAGFLKGTKDEILIDNIFDQLVQEIKFREKIFQIARIIQPPLKTIEKLFTIIDKGLPISHFNNFQYGGALMHLSLDEIIALTKRVARYQPLGCWVGLSLFYMYASFKNIRWVEIREYVKEILLNQNMLSVTGSNSLMDSYYWSEYVIKFLKDENDDDFATAITNQIIESSKLTSLKSTDRDAQKVSKILLEDYFDISWPLFAEFILENDFGIAFNLIHILETANGNFHINVDLFDEDHIIQNVIDWFKDNSIEDPIKLIKLFPSFSSRNKEWHPITKYLIDTYGNDEVILSEIGSKLGSFGFSGSTESYYKDQIMIMEQLLDHEIDKVREWAQSYIDYAKMNIKRTIIDEEEKGLR